MPIEHHWFHDWWNGMTHPTRLLNQHFGHGLTQDELHHSPVIHRQLSLPTHPSQHYVRPWQLDNKDIGSIVHYDKARFLVHLDVEQFSPEEVQVKVVDNFIVVEGKHEEKEDEHGHIFRHFVRKYYIPKQYDCDGIVTSRSSDGVLTITAPRADAIEGPRERVLPIMHTGPHKPIKVEIKDEENKK